MLASTVQFSNNTPEEASFQDQLSVTAGGIEENPFESFAFALKDTRVFFQDPIVCRYITTTSYFELI